jgi:hypothetical protein
MPLSAALPLFADVGRRTQSKSRGCALGRRTSSQGGRGRTRRGLTSRQSQHAISSNPKRAPAAFLQAALRLFWKSRRRSDPYYEMSGLDVVPVGIDELVLVGAARRAIQRSPLNLADIANLPFVTAQRQSARRMIEDSALLERGVVSKTIVLEFGHAEAIKRAVRCDMGLAFLFRCSIGDELAMGSLRVVPVNGLHVEVPICLTRRRGKYLSPSQSALYDYLRSGGLTGHEQERDEGSKPVRPKASDRR